MNRHLGFTFATLSLLLLTACGRWGTIRPLDDISPEEGLQIRITDLGGGSLATLGLGPMVDDGLVHPYFTLGFAEKNAREKDNVWLFTPNDIPAGAGLVFTSIRYDAVRGVAYLYRSDYLTFVFICSPRPDWPGYIVCDEWPGRLMQ